MGPSQVDVLIVGAGPVGLITAFQLARFGGGVSARIIEKHAKNMQDTYGRAITLYPRSIEMLDQLGLADELANQCFASRETVTYDGNGDEVKGRGWNFMENMKDTAWDFALVLRQKYQEEVYRKALKKFGVLVEAPVELISIGVDKVVPVGQHRITARVRNGVSGQESIIKCKYLIGSDGGRSSVRRMAGIPFEGSSTEDRWVRIDGRVKTNLPKPNTYCAIESPTHGNVLWVKLDRDAVRIGYAFTADRAKGYETFDEAAAIKEAIAAVHPFTLEFERVDWWTIYSIGQRIAKDFFTKDCIFLAGDAAHTHSSGAAQGLNTGIHDSVNLAWKLSLVLRGLAKQDVLHSYQAERLPNVQRLIQYDKDISRLMTNCMPEGYTGDPNEDVNVILGRVMGEAGTFSSGLGIFYDLQDGLSVSRMGSFQCGDELDSVRPGKRAPDGFSLSKPGTFAPTRLIPETPNHARFYVAIFAGNPETPKENEASKGLEESPFMARLRSKDVLSFLTILTTRGPSAYDLLGHEPLGRVLFDDLEQNAHRRYGINPEQGAIVVLRPDGWVGTMCRLEKTAAAEIEDYLGRIFE